jgi:hypothetical protein
MGHSNTENLTFEQTTFNELVERADNFMNIQIFRNARECYQMAIDMNIDNALVEEKLAVCNQKIKKETKTIIGTLLVVGIIAGAIIISRIL